MKNTAINALKYTGIVTLSQYIGSKKIKIAQTHNEGGSTLFEFLANCLIGDYTLAKIFRPTQIALLKRDTQKDQAGNYKYDLLGGFIHVLTKPEKVYSNGNCRVRYSFIIQKETIDSIPDFTDVYLGLYHEDVSDSTLGDYSAICPLGLTNTVVSAALVVDWELIISNMSSGE